MYVCTGSLPSGEGQSSRNREQMEPLALALGSPLTCLVVTETSRHALLPESTINHRERLHAHPWTTNVHLQ